MFLITLSYLPSLILGDHLQGSVLDDNHLPIPMLGDHLPNPILDHERIMSAGKKFIEAEQASSPSETKSTRESPKGFLTHTSLRISNSAEIIDLDLIESSNQCVFLDLENSDVRVVKAEEHPVIIVDDITSNKTYAWKAKKSILPSCGRLLAPHCCLSYFTLYFSVLPAPHLTLPVGPNWPSYPVVKELEEGES